MFEEVKMERMTWREFEAKKDRVLILPVGATEQHGPHLPLCVDAVLCRASSPAGSPRRLAAWSPPPSPTAISRSP